MKKNITLLIAIMFGFQLQAQVSIGEMRLKSAKQAAKSGRHEQALKYLKEAEKDFILHKNLSEDLRIEMKVLYFDVKDKILQSVPSNALKRKQFINEGLVFLRDSVASFSDPRLNTIYGLIEKNELLQDSTGQPSKAINDNVEVSSSSGIKTEKEKEIDKLKKELAKYKESVHLDIGTFEVLTDEIEVNGKKVVIDSVDVEIKDGFIRTVRVFTNFNAGDNKKGIFINHSPVSLIRYDDNAERQLYLSTNGKYRIDLGKVLSYVSEPGNNYTPDNNVVVLIPKQKKVIRTDEGLANYIDYRVYSDFLGLIDEASNGIVNFEAQACIPIIPSNVSGMNIYFFKSIKPHFRYSRFDKEDRAIAVSNEKDDGLKFVKNKLDMLQNAFINGGFTLDVFSYDPRRTMFHMNIPFKVNFNLTEVNATTKENVTSTVYGGGMELKFSRTNNFGMTLYGYVFEVRHHYNENKTIDKVKPFSVYNVGAEMFLYKNKADANSAIFLRLNYLSQITSSNNFFQLQIGYKSSLNL